MEHHDGQIIGKGIGKLAIGIGFRSDLISCEGDAKIICHRSRSRSKMMESIAIPGKITAQKS